ncbi:MAG: MFS transporter, partial [bacterium]|nr:MFS transporter [bacterium]
MLEEKSKLRWYEGISRYQWLVLVIASLGWVFDIFEGQVFVASMRNAMPDLLGVSPDDAAVRGWNNFALGSFLLGGAFGGVLFGILGDKIGRSRTMMITILFYSIFTCITAFAQAPWQMVVLRFFVAMGVGGEWAVASAMVAEVMPKRSRAVMSSIFHASSVFGTLLAAAVVVWVVTNQALAEAIGTMVMGDPDFIDAPWRLAFAIGVLPALLTIWVRFQLKEPDQWEDAQKQAKTNKAATPGRISELFSNENIRSTFVGVALSSIGLVTFWGGHIYGKNALLRSAQNQALTTEKVAPDADKATKEAAYEKHESSIKRSEMLSMVLNTIGGGLGLVLFGTISNWLGRKGAFIFYHLFAFFMMLVMFLLLIPYDFGAIYLAIALPIFGFFTLGMHAGYAVYFPELYPTRLRGTGTGFCFNMGRLATAAAIVTFGVIGAGWLGKDIVITNEMQALIISPLYLVGVVV